MNSVGCLQSPMLGLCYRASKTSLQKESQKQTHILSSGERTRYPSGGQIGSTTSSPYWHLVESSDERTKQPKSPNPLRYFTSVGDLALIFDCVRNLLSTTLARTSRRLIWIQRIHRTSMDQFTTQAGPKHRSLRSPRSSLSHLL